jgi:hypothetical protein
MCENEWLPYALSIGISESEFWTMNPHRIKIHAKAYEMKMTRLDELVWSFVGNYGLSAIATAIEHNLAGKKAKSKYINEPLTRKNKPNVEMTEDEIQRKRDEFVMRMETMAMNWKKNHPEVKENE